MRNKQPSAQRNPERIQLRGDRWRLVWLCMVAMLGFVAGISWHGKALGMSPLGNIYVEIGIAVMVLFSVWFLLWRDYRARAILQQQMNALNREAKMREDVNRKLERAYTEVEEKVRERTRDLTETKHELEESNALLNAVFQTMRAGILAMQHGRKHAFANQAFSDIWKLGTNDYQFECRRLLPRLYELSEEPDLLCKTLEEIGGETPEKEHSIVKLKDGRLLEFYSMPFSVGDKDIGRIHTFRDVTQVQADQVRLQETVAELETFKRALDFHAQVSICDDEGIINYVNEQLCEVSGYSEEEFLGNTHRLINSGEHGPEFFSNMWKVLRGGDIWRGEIRNRRKDGSHYWVKSTLVPFFDESGQPTRYLAISADITERKEYEEELQKAKEAAESAARAKSEFLANISHEIRTPMNAVLGFSELLSAEIEDERHREYLRLLTISGSTLLELINDLLDLSKIEAGKFSLQPIPFNLRSLVQEIQNIFLIRAQEKDLKVLVDIDHSLPGAIIGDEVRIRQILFNLVGNAVKFTEKGYVKISVETDFIDEENQRCTLIFSVKDTGVGISDENMLRIFEAFQQAEGQSLKKFGGTGLGLTITKRLVEMMGGTITVQSRSGKGSCFTVRLPQVEVPEKTDFYQHDVHLPADAALRFEPASLLVADDDVWNRRVLMSYLRDSGLTILEAENGQEALDKVREFHPDIVLMDMMLPEMKSIAIAEKIKKDKALSHIHVFLITAMNLEKVDRTYDTSNIDAYLFKPLDRKQLFTLLRRYLKTESVDDASSSSSSVQSSSEIHELSASMREDLPAVIEELEGSLMEHWSQIQKRMQSNALLSFSDALLEVGDRYDYAPLTRLAHELKKRVDVFDIGGIRSTLKRYPEMIENLKRMHHKNTP